MHSTIVPDLTEATGEGHRRARECFDEACLVLLSVEAENETFLAGVDDTVGPGGSSGSRRSSSGSRASSIRDEYKAFMDLQVFFKVFNCTFFFRF